MKKLILIAILLVSTISFAQITKVQGVNYKPITTTQRDGLSLGVNDRLKIFNSTTNQWEEWNGTTWIASASGGGGAVSSVNGQAGAVVLDPDDLDDSGTTNKFVDAGTIANITANTNKVGITTQQANDIIANNAKVSNVDQTLSLSGSDLSISGGNTVTLPNGGSADGSETKINAGTNVTVTGTGTTPDPYVINSTGGGGGAVSSVNTQTGAVVLDADDIDDTSTTNKFVTSGEKANITANTAKVSADGSISTHSDVDLTSIADGQVLKWSTANNRLQPANDNGGGGSSYTFSAPLSESGGTVNFDDSNFAKLNAANEFTDEQTVRDVFTVKTLTNEAILNFDTGNKAYARFRFNGANYATFSTAASGFSIYAAFTPGTNGTYDVGQTTRKWRRGYFSSTVSGADGVNADDFATKGQNDLAYGTIIKQDLIADQVNRILPIEKTTTLNSVSLYSSGGTVYYNTNTNTTYFIDQTTDGTYINGGNARVLVNTATQPVVKEVDGTTDATMIDPSNSLWTANTDCNLHVYIENGKVFYFFTKI